MGTYPVAQRRRPTGREKKEGEDGAESDSEKLRLGFCNFRGRLYVGEEGRESARGKGAGLRGGALGRVFFPNAKYFLRRGILDVHGWKLERYRRLCL